MELNERQEHRGMVERKRRKKFLYLKHTGQLHNYYKSSAIPVASVSYSKIEWWKKLIIWLKKLHLRKW